jgi:hypothetical protein
MIDEVLSGTAKADGVPGGMDNDRPIGVDDEPQSQLEEDAQHVPEEDLELPRTRASNLPRVRGQPVKRPGESWLVTWRPLWRIEELKLEVAIKLHKDNRKLELEMFKLTQTSQERMA